MMTIKEMAQHACVGLGKVSRVLNNAQAVHPKTRAWVQGAIPELGHHPNQSARQLMTKRPLTIGVILPLLTQLFSYVHNAGIVAGNLDPTWDYLKGA